MMMPLTVMTHFFENMKFVEDILSDPDSIKFICASQNLILKFQKDQTDYILLLSPETERSIQETQVELDFLKYLSQHGVRANTPIASQTGQEIATHDKYHAVVFTFLAGEHLELQDLDFFRWDEARRLCTVLVRGECRLCVTDMFEEKVDLVDPNFQRSSRATGQGATSTKRVSRRFPCSCASTPSCSSPNLSKSFN